jgi:predicted short-subunit dehydrogenase-like oxidoreductase (DUF2520 family)
VPRKSVAHKPTISIVGPGNLGRALALTLAAAGYHVPSLILRANSRRLRQAKSLARHIGAQIAHIGKQSISAEIVWITVPDDAIANVARALSQSGDWRGKIVFHSSGALASDELVPLQALGAKVASVHPMMSFVRGEVPEMAGVPFALEGDRAAVRAARSIVKNLGGSSFAIKKQNKVLYHVFGSFASPLVIALMATMEDVARAAGLRNRDIKPVVTPLLSQTLRNYQKHDAARAFSGPLARGDVATVSRHLAELQKLPHAIEVYRALAHSAVKRLPVKNAGALAAKLTRSKR